jgi:hypothetical protein
MARTRHGVKVAFFFSSCCNSETLDGKPLGFGVARSAKAQVLEGTSDCPLDHLVVSCQIDRLTLTYLLVF